MIGEITKSTVKYNGVTVGYMSVLRDERIAFQYDEQWVKEGFSVSPFSLPLDNVVRTNPKRTFGGLYGVFNDSLPDGWGELLVKRMLAQKGVNYDRLNPLTKLSLIRSNGLGGLTYEPTQAQPTQSLTLDFDVLADEAQEIWDNESKAIADLDQIYLLGGSSGGARPKAHLSCDGEDWIVKFPCRIDPPDVGIAEFRANLLAKKCGICVNEFRLFPSEKCSGYFGVKRFDRIGGKRLHMVSLSALLETTHRIPNLDYAHLFQVIQNICANQEDMYEAFRRMCFNVLYGNRDDHGKNFSFIYDEQLMGYTLSPAYDLTETRNKLEHEMTVLGNGKPRVKDLYAIGEHVKLNAARCRQIIEETTNVLQNN